MPSVGLSAALFPMLPSQALLKTVAAVKAQHPHPYSHSRRQQVSSWVAYREQGWVAACPAWGSAVAYHVAAS